MSAQSAHEALTRLDSAQAATRGTGRSASYNGRYVPGTWDTVPMFTWADFAPAQRVSLVKMRKPAPALSAHARAVPLDSAPVARHTCAGRISATFCPACNPVDYASHMARHATDSIMDGEILGWTGR